MAGASRKPIDERGYALPGTHLHKLAVKAAEQGKKGLAGHCSSGAVKVEKKPQEDEQAFGGYSTHELFKRGILKK